MRFHLHLHLLVKGIQTLRLKFGAVLSATETRLASSTADCKVNEKKVGTSYKFESF